MTRPFLTVGLLALTTVAALCQEKSPERIREDEINNRIMAVEGLQKEHVARVVASGVKGRIAAFHALFPDCTPSGEVSVRITKQPEHGTAETLSSTHYPVYPKDNIRSKCNSHKVRGIEVQYKSAEKYIGNDALDLLVLFPGGFAWEINLDISVR